MHPLRPEVAMAPGGRSARRCSSIGPTSRRRRASRQSTPPRTARLPMGLGRAHSPASNSASVHSPHMFEIENGVISNRRLRSSPSRSVSAASSKASDSERADRMLSRLQAQTSMPGGERLAQGSPSMCVASRTARALVRPSPPLPLCLRTKPTR